MPDKLLMDLMDQAIVENITAHITHDHTAEKIFLNDISVWKNLGNFAFIDNVGQSFSDMNFTEEYYNSWTDEVDALRYKIYQSSNVFENVDFGHNQLQNEQMRLYLRNVHERRCWLKYVAAEIRSGNRKNMKAIGITEEEVIAFTDSRVKEDAADNGELNDDDFYTPFLEPDGSTGVWGRLSSRISK